MESEDEGGKGGEQADRSTALIPIVRIPMDPGELGSQEHGFGEEIAGKRDKW